MDHNAALESHKRALYLRIKHFGEGHPNTAHSYHSIGFTQHSLMDYTAALESHKRAFEIRFKLFGEEDPTTVSSSRSVSYLKSLSIP